jgi:8-oxo-dGTP diphosphatase
MRANVMHVLETFREVGMREIDKLGWIKIDNAKLLLARSYGKELFYIPGGKRDPGESDQEALIREVEEELQVKIIPETLIFAGNYMSQADGKADGVVVKLTCYFGDAIGVIKADSEIEEVQYLSYADLDKVSLVTKLVMRALKEQGRIG